MANTEIRMIKFFQPKLEKLYTVSKKQVWELTVAQMVKRLLNAGDQGSIPGLGRSPGEGNSYPLQYPGLENFMDCLVHGVAKSRTQLSNFHSSSH